MEGHSVAGIGSDWQHGRGLRGRRLAGVYSRRKKRKGVGKTYLMSPGLWPLGSVVCVHV